MRNYSMEKKYLMTPFLWFPGDRTLPGRFSALPQTNIIDSWGVMASSCGIYLWELEGPKAGV